MTATLHALTPTEWRLRAEEHAARVDVWIRPHLERRRRGERHPVHDFLFDYYRHSPAKLRAWHPGYGVTLRGAAHVDGYADRSDYVLDGDDARVAGATRDDRRPLIRALHALLSATAGRPPSLGCFGLHEWAMVYRSGRHGTRHPEPLRLGADDTDRVVESHRIACSHFDAYRFFTPSARGLNRLDPHADDRAAYEQPGCLHAGMDLYKHAFRLSPLVPSELVADCFALAWDIRELDMRASPYDLTEWGYQPVRIETAAGKQAYAAAQRAFTERGAPLRRKLIDACEQLLA